MELIASSQQSYTSVNLFIAALVHEWKKQCALRHNANPSPRTSHITAILSAYRITTDRRKRDNYDDKGHREILPYLPAELTVSLDALNEGIQTIEDLRRTYDFFMKRNSIEGLRDLCAHSIGVFSLFRSDNQRGLDLSDLSSTVYASEGRTEGFVVVLVMRRGKNLQRGQIAYGGFMRHRHVLACPVATLAMYLFAR